MIISCHFFIIFVPNRNCARSNEKNITRLIVGEYCLSISARTFFFPPNGGRGEKCNFLFQECFTLNPKDVEAPDIQIKEIQGAFTELDEGGEIEIEVIGDSPFTYQWSHDSSIDLPIVTDLEMGLYSVTVTDVDGCSNSRTFEILNCDATIGRISLEADITPLTSSGSSTGAITPIIEGGQEPFYFTWITPTGVESVRNQINISAGKYSLTVTDGCSTASFTKSIRFCGDEPHLSVRREVEEICFVDGAIVPGEVELFPSGSVDLFPIQEYRWEKFNDQINVLDWRVFSKGKTNKKVEGLLEVERYRVIIRDAMSCEDTVDIPELFKANENLFLTEVGPPVICGVQQRCRGMNIGAPVYYADVQLLNDNPLRPCRAQVFCEGAPLGDIIEGVAKYNQYLGPAPAPYQDLCRVECECEFDGKVLGFDDKLTTTNAYVNCCQPESASVFSPVLGDDDSSNDYLVDAINNPCIAFVYCTSKNANEGFYFVEGNEEGVVAYDTVSGKCFAFYSCDWTGDFETIATTT